MLPLLEVGTLIKESLIKESHCLTLWLSLFYAYGSYSISNSKRKLLFVWYMSVKDKVADWYNMETGEALCCYKVTRKDELLQDIYLDEDIFPNSG